jgi:hypothetical protein
MPGATFFAPATSMPGAGAEPRPTAATAPEYSLGSFLFWVAVFGVIVPVVVLGGLHAGRFRFVFTSR